MRRTLLAESIRGETRLAVIEDGRLCELYVERPDAADAAGSIYLGRVQNVLPGMNAAFVDIGTEKNAFLAAGDIAAGDRDLARKLGDERIESLVRPGQEIMVQISKAQSGQKGHRVTCHVTLPGRALVLLPGMRYVGVSKKISEDGERSRLRDIAMSMIGGDGVIVRTAAAGVDESALRSEYQALCAQWAEIEGRARLASAPKRLFSNDDLLLCCARDMLDDDVDAVWVEGEALRDRLLARVNAFAPRWAERVRLHEGETPLFDLHRVDQQLDKALRKYVWLDSGGSLVIEETEAMTVIDVNTGKFTGRRDVDETLFRLNCEAAREIVRQLRLRDIGGIVIVDFIDMRRPGDNEALLDRLRELVAGDRNRLTVVGMSALGLVELTRKKARRPLSRQLLHTCSDCGGDGVVPSHETTARRAVREIWRRRRSGQAGALLVEADGPVVGWLRTIGVPEGGAVYAHADPAMRAGTYVISPADVSNLPDKCKQLK